MSRRFYNSYLRASSTEMRNNHEERSYLSSTNSTSRSCSCSCNDSRCCSCCSGSHSVSCSCCSSSSIDEVASSHKASSSSCSCSCNELSKRCEESILTYTVDGVDAILCMPSLLRLPSAAVIPPVASADESRIRSSTEDEQNKTLLLSRPPPPLFGQNAAAVAMQKTVDQRDASTDSSDLVDKTTSAISIATTASMTDVITPVVNSYCETDPLPASLHRFTQCPECDDASMRVTSSSQGVDAATSTRESEEEHGFVSSSSPNEPTAVLTPGFIDGSLSSNPLTTHQRDRTMSFYPLTLVNDAEMFSRSHMLEAEGEAFGYLLATFSLQHHALLRLEAANVERQKYALLLDEQDQRKSLESLLLETMVEVSYVYFHGLVTTVSTQWNREKKSLICDLEDQILMAQTEAARARSVAAKAELLLEQSKSEGLTALTKYFQERQAQRHHPQQGADNVSCVTATPPPSSTINGGVEDSRRPILGTVDIHLPVHERFARAARYVASSSPSS